MMRLPSETALIKMALLTSGSITVKSKGRVHSTPPQPQPKILRRDERAGRNDDCPCGSGKKFKKCCLRNVKETGLLD